MFSVNFTLASFQPVTIGPSGTAVAIGNIGPREAAPPAAQPAPQPTPLVVPWHDIQPDPDIFSLLSWHTRISGFAGRDDEMNLLHEWAALPQRVSIKFITGDGGTGKSRLAAEFAGSLGEQGWAAGFVNLRRYASFPMTDKGTLLVIDYPEENRTAVSELLNDLAMLGVEPGVRVRVLFLTRASMENWFDFILDCNALDLTDTASIHLGGLPVRPAYEVYTSALEESAEILDTNPPPLSEEALDHWLKLTPENRKALFILAAAVYSSLYPDDEVVRYTGPEVIQALADREISRLRRIAQERNAADPNVFARVLAMAAVAEKIPVEVVADCARRPELALGFDPNADVRTELKEAALLSYDVVRAPGPDIVAAAFTVAVLAEKPDTAEEVLWAALCAHVETGLERVGRLAYDAEVGLGLHEHRMSGWLCRAVEGKRERCEELKTLVYAEPSTPLVGAAVVVIQTLLDHAEDEALRAQLLNNLSLNLGYAGDKQAALAAISQAVEIRQILAKADPKRFGPVLATSLSTWAKHLSAVGERTTATEKANEAVAIHRRLAQSDPKRYEPKLAGSLNNLSICRRHSGDKTGALQASRDAVKIFRGLAKAYPQRYEPALAGSRCNLANNLREKPDREGALKQIRDAESIYRRLAETHPERYEPQLATSLDILGTLLSEKSEGEGALEAFGEAVDIRRRLAKAYPDRYEPELALSLNTLALILLMEKRHREVALKRIREAESIYRRLAKAYPDRYESELATSLNTLALALLIEKRNCEAALEAIDEAVDIRRRLADGDPKRYWGNLALSLIVRGFILKRLDMSAEVDDPRKEGTSLIDESIRKGVEEALGLMEKEPDS